jgi:hypothetical protein
VDRARKMATSLVVILVVATVLRLGFMWEQQRKIPEQALRSVPFLYEAGEIAFAVATGYGYSDPFRQHTGPTAWLTPVYPLLVAGIFKVFGLYTLRAFLACVYLNILFEVLACIPIFAVGRKLGGMALGAGAAWLWAVFPNGVIIPFEWVWDTCLSALLGATILWATLKLDETRRLDQARTLDRTRQPPVRHWVAYGLLWGFTLLTNPTFFSVLPFLLAWLGYRARRRGESRVRWLGRPAWALVVATLCCVPWTIRNYERFGVFVPLRSNLGVELWLGNNEQYRDNWPGWLHPIDNQSERRQYAEMGEIQYSKEKQEEAIEFITSHPGTEARLFVRRFVAMWVGLEHPVKAFIETRSTLIRGLLVSNFLLAAATLSGLLALARRRSGYVFPLAVFPVLFPIAYYFTRPLLRYRHPIDPVLCLLAAAAIEQLTARLRRSGKSDETHATLQEPEGTPLSTR